MISTRPVGPMNELPIQQFYVDPYDRWEGFAAERTRLIEFLRDNVKNVVFLTADVHANLVNDVRLQTLEAGGPVNSGILEVTSGPSGTDSFKDDINDDTGNPQVADLANAFFLRQPPPTGPGIQCSNLDVFSYHSFGLRMTWRISSCTAFCLASGTCGLTARANP